MSDPLRARLEELVAELRQLAQPSAGPDDTGAMLTLLRNVEKTYARCADKLEAVLRAVPAAAPPADATKLLQRYLQNHCDNADGESMSGLCECYLCRDARTFLGMPLWDTARTSTPEGC